jgi:hypothetical protein
MIYVPTGEGGAIGLAGYRAALRSGRLEGEPCPATRREQIDDAVFDFRTGLFYCVAK